MPNFVVQKDFKAPKMKLESDGSRLARTFKKGEIISGSAGGYSMFGGQMVHYIKCDEFAIPAEYLYQLKPELFKSLGDDAQILNQSTKDIVNRNLIDDLTLKSKSSMTGVGLGMFIGGAYAITKGKNFLPFAFWGGLAGGITGYYTSKFLKKQ